MAFIEDKVNFFFDNQLFLDKTNRKFQVECFEELKKINFPFNIFSESRNYQHSISIISDYNQNGDPTVLKESENDYSLEFLSSFFDSKIFRVGIHISDVGTIYKTNWGVKNYLNKNEKWFSSIQQTDLPEAIQRSFGTIETFLQKQLNFIRLSPEELNAEMNLVNHNVKFTATIDELLFGGLDLYNQLGI